MTRAAPCKRLSIWLSRWGGIVPPLLAEFIVWLGFGGLLPVLPALYAVVAENSPPGRSSTAQGLFGVAATLGFIAASLIVRVLAAVDILYPLYVFSAVPSVESAAAAANLG